MTKAKTGNGILRGIYFSCGIHFSILDECPIEIASMRAGQWFAQQYWDLLENGRLVHVTRPHSTIVEMEIFVGSVDDASRQNQRVLGSLPSPSDCHGLLRGDEYAKLVIKVSQGQELFDLMIDPVRGDFYLREIRSKFFLKTARFAHPGNHPTSELPEKLPDPDLQLALV